MAKWAECCLTVFSREMLDRKIAEMDASTPQLFFPDADHVFSFRRFQPRELRQDVMMALLKTYIHYLCILLLLLLLQFIPL